MIYFLQGLILSSLLAIIPISIYGDETWFLELGLVENIQLIVLCISALLSLYWYVIPNNTKRYKSIWAIGVWSFCLAAAREVSWGRIFFPIGINEDGPVFYSMSDLWFGPYIHGAVGISICILLFFIIYYRYVVSNILKVIYRDIICRLYLLGAIILFLVSELVFERNYIEMISPFHIGLEEMTELTVYMILLFILVRLHNLLNDEK